MADLKDRINKIIAAKRNPNAEEQILIDGQLKVLNNTPVSKNTIAIIEPHLGHSEVYPSFIKYFLELGYNVHLFVLEENFAMNSLCRCDFDKINVFKFPKMPVNQEFFDKLLRYKYLFIGTLCTHDGYHFILNLEEKYQIKYRKNNVYAVVHDVLSYNCSLNVPEKRFMSDNRAFVLRDGLKYNDKTLPFIVPVYFGDISITKKSQNFTRFIIIGGGNKKGLRNFKLLFDSIDELINKDYKFDVTFIGVADDRISEYISEKNNAYIRNLGKLPFDKMIKELEDSDYILFNIDPECEDYQKYLLGGISGTYSLSLAFCKPSIIYKDLADTYKLVDKSIIYRDSELFKAMEKAILLQQDDYNIMQFKLQKMKEYLINKSKENMEEVFIYE